MMPPAAIRRPLTISACVATSSLVLLLSPLILAGGALVAALIGRPQPRILARLLIAYFARELGVLVACGALWLASGCGLALHRPRLRHAHYRLLHWFVHGLAVRVRTVLDIDVTPDPSPAAARALDGERPLLLFSRHAGPGDTLLLVDELVCRHRRLPSVVFKETLSIDPSIDLIGHRLPHAILDTSDPGRCEARIAEVAAQLGRRGVLVLFPEGGNFTPERRRRALRSLRRRGRRREAAEGEQLSHMLPPHAAGALAALAGRPEADVVFAAHTGLGLAAFPRELWRETPIGGTLKSRMWLAPAAERPRDPDAQVRWLYAWWKRLDTWVTGEGDEDPCDAEVLDLPERIVR